MQDLVGLGAVGRHYDHQAEGEQSNGPAGAGPGAARGDQNQAEEQDQVAERIADIDDLGRKGLVAFEAGGTKHEAPGKCDGGRHNQQPVEQNPQAGGRRQRAGREARAGRPAAEGNRAGRRRRRERAWAVGPVHQPVAGQVDLSCRIGEDAEAAKEGGSAAFFSEPLPTASQWQKAENAAQNPADALNQVIHVNKGMAQRAAAQSMPPAAH